MSVRRILTYASAFLCCTLVTYSAFTHWLAWRFAMGDWPVPPGTPWTYQLESGFIPALTVLTLLGAVAGAYHAHNCHQDGCFRIGKHKIDGTPWCSRHEAQARNSPQQVTLEAIATLLSVTNERLGELPVISERLVEIATLLGGQK